MIKKYEFYHDCSLTLEQKGTNCSVIDAKSVDIIECPHVSSSQFYLIFGLRVSHKLFELKISCGRLFLMSWLNRVDVKRVASLAN